MSKNNALASQFPSIYRRITENKLFKKFKNLSIRLQNQPKVKKIFYYFSIILGILVIFVLILGISLISFKVYKNFNQAYEINLEREKIQREINFWTSVTNKYSGYKDAYFRVAVLEYNLGNFNKAKKFNKKALLLDPNYLDSKKLEEILNKNQNYY